MTMTKKKNPTVDPSRSVFPILTSSDSSESEAKVFLTFDWRCWGLILGLSAWSIPESHLSFPSTGPIPCHVKIRDLDIFLWLSLPLVTVFKKIVSQSHENNSKPACRSSLSHTIPPPHFFFKKSRQYQIMTWQELFSVFASFAHISSLQSLWDVLAAGKADDEGAQIKQANILVMQMYSASNALWHQSGESPHSCTANLWLACMMVWFYFMTLLNQVFGGEHRNVPSK